MSLSVFYRHFFYHETNEYPPFACKICKLEFSDGEDCVGHFGKIGNDPDLYHIRCISEQFTEQFRSGDRDLKCKHCVGLGQRVVPVINSKSFIEQHEWLTSFFDSLL